MSLPAIIVAYENAAHFSGSAIDGPFQLYNALRRIQAGFRPGVDFQFFHGLGLPFLLYGPYRLFGGGLHGSQLAREVITAVIQPLVFVVAFRVFTGSWRKSFALSALGMCVALLLRLSAVLFALNGMVGLRSALPTLLPVAAYAIRDRRWRIGALGVGLGMALFLSTEQGLAVVFAFVLVATVGALRAESRGREFLTMAATIAIAGAVFVACLVAVGGIAGMHGALRYNLRLVPMDQYWYFGAPPNVFVPSWSAGLRMSAKTPLVGGAIILSASLAAFYLRRFWREPRGENAGRDIAFAFLAMYGFISCASLLGVFTPAYVQPCWRVLIIIALVELARATTSIQLRGHSTFLGVPSVVGGSALAGCIAVGATIPLVPVSLGKSLPHIVERHLIARAPFTVDSMWHTTLAVATREVQKHRGPQGESPSIWSTYAGWIEARDGAFHPSFDYIIHALGPNNRRAYVDTFRVRRPALVQTVRPSYTQYEGWLENNSWALYDALLDSYSVDTLTPWSLFWTRRAAPAPAPVLIASMRVPPGLTAVALPPIPDSLSSPVMLLEIDVDYEVRNPLRRLPIVGTTPRYLIGLEGALSRVPISLDPFVTHMRFPLIVERGKPAALRFQTFSLLPGAGWAPKALAVSVRPIDDGAREWFSEATAVLRARR